MSHDFDCKGTSLAVSLVFCPTKDESHLHIKSAPKGKLSVALNLPDSDSGVGRNPSKVPHSHLNAIRQHDADRAPVG